MATVSADQEVAVAEEPVKKPAAKKTVPKKTAAKKSATKKTAKSTAKKAAAKKASTKKTPAKKTPAKKVAAKKTAATKAAPLETAAEKTTSAGPEPVPEIPALAAQPEAPRSLSPLASVVDDARTLGRLLAAYRRGDYREVPATKVALVAVGIAYVASPLDLLPDVVPTGLLDDALVLALVLRAVKTEVDSFGRWEQGRRRPS